MDLGLSGKTVVVTGATANIGRAIALDFAGEGAKLVAIGRDHDAGAKLVEAALARGAQDAVFVGADLRDADAAAKIVEATKPLGPVWALINNVGGNEGAGLFVDSDPASWQGDVDINFLATLRVTHALLPGMIEGGAGRVVNIGSAAGIAGEYMLPLYSAAKAAVHGFTHVLAKEVGQHSITVNAVAPYGTVSTSPEAYSKGSRFHPDNNFFGTAFAGATEADNARRARKGPLPRSYGFAEDVSGLVLFLASIRAGFVTGQVLQVDGGTLL